MRTKKEQKQLLYNAEANPRYITFRAFCTSTSERHFSRGFSFNWTFTKRLSMWCSEVSLVVQDDSVSAQTDLLIGTSYILLAKETRNIIWREGIILSMPKEAFMYLPSHLESHLEPPILVYWAFVAALILFEQQPPQHRDLYYPVQNINQLKKLQWFSNLNPK